MLSSISKLGVNAVSIGSSITEEIGVLVRCVKGGEIAARIRFWYYLRWRSYLPTIERIVKTRCGIVLLCGILNSACSIDPRSQLEYGNDHFAQVRRDMVVKQLTGRDIVDESVLRVMAEIPRHLFVGEKWQEFAYADHPLPIGEGQTISQPYIVAFMTQALILDGGEKVLEVGTGSGYQAAVLGALVEEVYTIEIVPLLAQRSAALIEGLGYGNIRVREGDGYLGWPEAAPFDAVMVTAAPDHVPEPLVEQLNLGGRLVLPVGDDSQQLLRLTRTQGGVMIDTLLPVRFVPMTGQALEQDQSQR